MVMGGICMFYDGSMPDDDDGDDGDVDRINHNNKENYTPPNDTAKRLITIIAMGLCFDLKAQNF